MTKSNKPVMVTVRMTELQLSQLEYVQEAGETRSATIRRLINEEWCDQMHERDAENRFNVADYLPPQYLERRKNERSAHC